MHHFNKQVVFILTILFYFPAFSFAQNEDFNSSRNWGIELQATKKVYAKSIGSDLFYRSNKNCYFAGVGIKVGDFDKNASPNFKVGYRRYPGKNMNDLKFYYQTFLYHSSSPNDYKMYGKYLTANFGVGIEYKISQKFSAGLNTNLGWGPDFIEKSGVFTIFPVQLSLSYKFKKYN